MAGRYLSTTLHEAGEETYLVVGNARIARYLGVSLSCFQNWRKNHAFPVGILPDGRIATTRNLVDQWVLARAAIKNQRVTRDTSSSDSLPT